MYVKSEACPLGWSSGTSRGVSSTQSLGAQRVLRAGPRVRETLVCSGPCSLLGLWHVSPSWFSKLDILGAHLSGAVLKGWGTLCGVRSNPLLLRGVLGAASFWLRVSCRMRDAGRGEGPVSHPFPPASCGLLLCLVCRSCSVLRFFPA